MSEQLIKKVCWRSDWVRPYESLWCLLQKFAYLNAVDHRELRNLLGQPNGKWHWSHKASDLRTGGRLSRVLLAHFLPIDKRRIDESLTSAFLNEEHVPKLAASSLRFCYECLRAGYHSTLHQVYLIGRCKTHSQELVEGCPECGAELPYRLSGETFAHPFRCESCQLYLLPADRRSYKRDDFNSTSEHKQLAKALVKLKEGKIIYRSSTVEWHRWLQTMLGSRVPYRMFPPHPVGQGLPNARFTRVLAWKTGMLNHHRENLIEYPVKRNIDVRQMVIMPSHGNRTGRKVLENRELVAVYKSIYRLLLRRFARHRRCLVGYQSTCYWDNNSSSCSERICPVANAFLLWRMYYEQLRHPHKIFKKTDRRILLETFWERPRGVDSLACQKVFAYECYWTFFECLARAFSWYKRVGYSLSPLEVRGAFIPVFYLTRENGVSRISASISPNQADFIDRASLDRCFPECLIKGRDNIAG